MARRERRLSRLTLPPQPLSRGPRGAKLKLGYPLAHPAKGILAQRRISVKAAAEAANVSPRYLGRSLNGWIPVSRRVRQALTDLLGMSEADLFFETPPEPRYPGDLAIGKSA
jgi:hypothetical protein